MHLWISKHYAYSTCLGLRSVLPITIIGLFGCRIYRTFELAQFWQVSDIGDIELAGRMVFSYVMLFQAASQFQLHTTCLLWLKAGSARIVAALPCPK
jgi:hypothetical protein